MPIQLIKTASFEDCHRELIHAGGAVALAAYGKWRKRRESDPAFSPVVGFVESFTRTHTRVFNI